MSDGGRPQNRAPHTGSGRGRPDADGGVLNITAGFHWWRSGNKKRTQNVSECMLVLALCLVYLFGRPFVKRFALCYRTVFCPVPSVCLSVTLLYCGQTVGWIKLKLDKEIGLGYSHILLDRDQKRGTAPNFQPMSVVAKRLNGSKCHLVWR